MYVGEACCMLLPIFDINYKFGHVNIHVLSSIRIHMLYCLLKLYVRPFAQVGTPVCVLQKDFTDIGRIASIRFNEKAVDHAKKGQKVTIKVWHIVVD